MFKRIRRKHRRSIRTRPPGRFGLGGLESLEARQLLAADLVYGPEPAEAYVSEPVLGMTAMSPSLFQQLSSAELADNLLRAAIHQNQYLFGQSRLYYPTHACDCVRVFNNLQFNDLELAEVGAFAVDSTNVQESGIDEADLIETDGRYLYTINNGALLIVDAQDPNDLRTVSRTSLEATSSSMYLNPTGMYLHNGRITLVSSGMSDYQFEPLLNFDNLYWPLQQSVQITTLDVNDPSNPTVVGKTEFNGSLVDSRMVDGQLQLVINNRLNLPPVEFLPDEDPLENTINPNEAQIAIFPWHSRPGRYETQEEYVARIHDTILDVVSMPSYSRYDADGNLIEETVLDQDSVHRLLSDSDLEVASLTTVLTFDAAASEPQVVDQITLMDNSWSPSVYASTGSIFLLNEDYSSGETITEIKAFDVTSDGTLSFKTAGSVSGELLNRFSVDEHDGYLRVFTTSNGRLGPTDVWLPPVNDLYVLTTATEEMQVAGHITDIAPGERIQSATFQDDQAILVTFRQIDPLFGVDLSDPENPEILGELKITGFSRHLQFLGDGLLLGIGQAGNDFGTIGRQQVALFDVTDLSDPKLINRFNFDHDEYTFAAYDLHAITYLPTSKLLAIPVNGNWQNNDNELFVFHVDATDGLQLVHTVEHAGHVNRSVQIGAAIISVSSHDIVATDIATLTTADSNLIVSQANDDDFTIEWYGTEVEIDVLANDLLATDASSMTITDVSSWMSYLDVRIADDGQSIFVSVSDESPPVLSRNLLLLDSWVDPDSPNWFSYTIEDDLGNQSNGRVTVNVEREVWPESDVLDIELTTSAVELDVLSNDKGDNLTLIGLHNVPDDISAEISPDGRSILVTVNNIARTDSPLYHFAYEATTLNGFEYTSSVTLQVHPANWAQDDSFSFTDLHNEQQLNVLSNDNSDGLSMLEITNRSWQLVTRIADDGQSILVKRDESIGNWPGSYFVEYAVVDRAGSISKARANVDFIPATHAVNDNFSVSFADKSVVLDVLANDYQLNGPVRIVSIDNSATLGEVAISDDALSVIYTPSSDRGADSFGYVIEDDDGIQSRAFAWLNAVDSATDELVIFTVETVDSIGNRIDTIRPGEDFTLNLYVQDASPHAAGVFAAYVDVLFDSGLVAFNGDIQYGSDYRNVPSGTKNEGLIDELGGVSGIHTLDGGTYLVASVPFTAIAPGTVTFSTDAADDIQQHIVLRYFGEEAVTNIQFEQTTLIVSGDNNVAGDTNGDGIISPLDVLLIINELELKNQHAENEVTEAAIAVRTAIDSAYDLNQDGTLSPLDAMVAIIEVERFQRELTFTTTDPPRAAMSSRLLRGHVVTVSESKDSEEARNGISAAPFDAVTDTSAPDDTFAITTATQVARRDYVFASNDLDEPDVEATGALVDSLLDPMR